jgi:hypothetical protein
LTEVGSNLSHNPLLSLSEAEGEQLAHSAQEISIKDHGMPGFTGQLFPTSNDKKFQEEEFFENKPP